jgi:hypothetical protein
MVTTPLRERMRRILRTRNYSPRTEETYIEAVARFARHFGKSPDQLGAAQITEYQIWLRESKHVSASLFNQIVCALRFLYVEVLDRRDEVQRIAYARGEKRLPVVLSPEETARFLWGLFGVTPSPFASLERCSTHRRGIFHSDEPRRSVCLPRCRFRGVYATTEGSSVVLWHDLFASSSPAPSTT